jgi:hypothetical protein
VKQIILTLILVLSILSISSATQQPKAQQWEYKFDYKCRESKANELAAQGWELVAISESGGMVSLQTCAFRRPKP